MDLSTYFRETKTTATALAEQLGVRVSTITRLREGRRAASLDLALRIERATGGLVRAEDLPAQRTTEREPARAEVAA